MAHVGRRRRQPVAPFFSMLEYAWENRVAISEERIVIDMPYFERLARIAGHMPARLTTLESQCRTLLRKATGQPGAQLTDQMLNDLYMIHEYRDRMGNLLGLMYRYEDVTLPHHVAPFVYRFLHRLVSLGRGDALNFGSANFGGRLLNA